MVYRIFHEDQERYDYDTEFLDGDFSKVAAFDLEPDDGPIFSPSGKMAGRRINGENLPTKVRFEGPRRELTDYQEVGYLSFDQKFKDIVEELEPGIHQFFPVEFVWKDGTHAYHRYWFNVCNRLDTVDRDKTTKEFRNIWMNRSDGKFVFNKGQIGSNQLWIDKFMSTTMGVLMSNEMHDALVAARVTGMGFNAFEETE